MTQLSGAAWAVTDDDGTGQSGTVGDVAFFDDIEAALEAYIVDPNNPTGHLLDQVQPPSAGDLQATYDSIAATGGQTGQGSYGGGPQTVTTSQGVNVNVRGDKVRYDEFTDLLPSQQHMNVGAAEAGGKFAPDYLEEMERSRPKGAAAGAASYG